MFPIFCHNFAVRNLNWKIGFGGLVGLAKKPLPEVDAKNIFTAVIYDITTVRIMPNSIMISIIDTRHKDFIAILSIIKLIGTLSVNKSQHKSHFYINFKCHYTEYHDGKCRIFYYNAECRYSEYHYAERRYADCHYAGWMSCLSVII